MKTEIKIDPQDVLEKCRFSTKQKTLRKEKYQNRKKV